MSVWNLNEEDKREDFLASLFTFLPKVWEMRTMRSSESDSEVGKAAPEQEVFTLFHPQPLACVCLGCVIVWDYLFVYCEDVFLPRHLLIGLIKS